MTNVDSHVNQAVSAIDRSLDAPYKHCFFRCHLTEAERDEVKKIVIKENRWLEELYSYEYIDEKGEIGIVFTWSEKEIEELRKYYTIK